MQKIINQILEGNFDYENGSLDFSCAKIEISLHKGEQYEGSFHIFSPQGQFTSGTVISSDLRMECLTSDFIGGDEEISFCFHGENMEEGDVVKGNFYIISNQGEYYIPFVVSIERTVLESSIGTIKNLFHFANLAKSNWQEAVNLFYSPEFPVIFQGSDAKFLDDYRALSAVEGWEQNVEEFLIQINKKQKVEFLVEEQELLLDALTAQASYAVMERELTIVRNGWGYTRLYVECNGDFLFTEKEVLTDDDFLGNHCRLPVFIDSSFCRKGKNFGQIFLYNSYVSLTIPVTVRTGESSVYRSTDLSAKRNVVQLMEFYQAFRTRKIGTSTWLKETGKLVERQVSMDENNIAARLFQAQLLITEERYNEAGWILDHVSELLEKGQGNDTLLAYYLYLTTLIHREEKYVNQVAAEVERIYRQDNSNWRVAWLLLYLSEEYHKSITGKWVFLEKQFNIGCSSPVLYIEAMALLNNNPALLRRLGSFERQVLMYGSKQDILKPEVVEQFVGLTCRMREYSQTVYRILVRLYKKNEDVRILQEICTLLIKGGKTGEKYLAWYQAGIENQLRITNLYEYYMMSLNLNRTYEIPKMVLLYFSYQNNLDYEHCAYLYDYILKNADKLGDIPENYRIRMEHFCVDQILKRHINRQLADLYNRLLQPGMINEQTAEALSSLLFANLIRVEDDRLRKVYVYQPGNLYPEEYVLNGGETWVALYGNDCTIVFEDAWSNRFIRNAEYTIEKLMVPGKFLRMILPLAKSHPALDLYLCDSERSRLEDGEENIERALRVVSSGYCDSRMHRELVLRILQHYYDTDNMRCLDEYLQTIAPEELSMEERSIVIRFMVLRGNFELAGEWLETYGPYFMDAKILVRLISPLMEKSHMMEDTILTASAVYAFQKGKYDSTVLQYLVLYYRGMTKSMRDIWKAARAFGVDCFRLSETILVQMLYSGAFVGEKMEIFRYYISQGPKPEVEEAFLAQCAYDYFVKDRVMESDVFQEIQAMYLRGEPVQRVCRLAYLKYYAEAKPERTEQVNRLAEGFLHEMMSDGIHLEFFRAYKENREVALELADKTIIEYHANPRGKTSIHYVILHENGESDEYTTEYMQEVLGGVCFKEFVLFFGETLQYYITEERNGEEQLTESGNLQKSDIRGEGHDSRYQLVNDIVISKTLEDFDTMDNLLEEYKRKEFLNGKLFGLK